VKLIRWDPYIDLVTLQEKLNRLFESNLTKSRYDEEEIGSGVWAPPVDILERRSPSSSLWNFPGLTKKASMLR
jgi:translation elongation factor EF-1beta